MNTEQRLKKITPNELVEFNKTCRSLIELINSDKSIKTKAQLFKNANYSYSSWKRKSDLYQTKAYTLDLIKKIDELLEARLIEHGLDNPKGYGFIIFLLKNYYGYQDKREVETEHTHVFKVTRGNTRALKAKQRKIVASKQKP